MLPRRRKSSKMGLREAVRRVFPSHRSWVRKHACSIKGCEASPIEFAHLRTAANSGTGLKPSDAFGLSLCREHHRRGHDIGHDAMARENGMTLDELHKIAAEFTKRTTDKALREALKLVDAEAL